MLFWAIVNNYRVIIRLSFCLQGYSGVGPILFLDFILCTILRQLLLSSEIPNNSANLLANIDLCYYLGSPWLFVDNYRVIVCYYEATIGYYVVIIGYSGLLWGFVTPLYFYQ